MYYNIGKIKLWKGKNIVFDVKEAFEDIKVCLDDKEGCCKVFIHYGNDPYADEKVKVKLVDKKDADFIFQKVDNIEDADFYLSLTSL